MFAWGGITSHRRRAIYNNLSSRHMLGLIRPKLVSRWKVSYSAMVLSCWATPTLTHHCYCRWSFSSSLAPCSVLRTLNRNQDANFCTQPLLERILLSTHLANIFLPYHHTVLEWTFSSSLFQSVLSQYDQLQEYNETLAPQVLRW